MPPDAQRNGLPVKADRRSEALGPTRSWTAGAWTICDYEEVISSNDTAAALPVWHAVRAARQSRGRGRFERTWVSDLGGLWISAVVPTPLDPQECACLPLVAGWAVGQTLERLSVSGLRLRWPNDVMIGKRKLAGLLVDRHRADSAVVGVGINVTNQPEKQDPSLQGAVVRLSDVLVEVPGLDLLTTQFLETLAAATELWQREGFGPIERRLKSFWEPNRHVTLDLDGVEISGTFLGVDPAGRLGLGMSDGETRYFEPHQVRQLTEVS